MTARRRRPLQDKWAGGPKVLVAFSDGLTSRGRLRARDIFDRLTQSERWYLPRQSRFIVPNQTTIIFYQSAVGIVGYASVMAVAEVKESEAVDVSTTLGLGPMRAKITLSNLQVFAKPVSLRPLVEKLDFISNKKYWGHSVRTTPRTINDADFAMIVRASTLVLNPEQPCANE